ncbi:NAD-dependent deacetylase, variant 2 [Balamuthia mandrillaris]
MNMYRRVPPHAGFSVLLDIVKQKDNNYFIFTSNVDGHFQKAGFDDNKIVEYHGSIHHWQCHTHCNKRNQIWDASHINIAVDEEEMTAFEPFPDCPHCSDLPRPNILMFDDKGWIPRRTRQQQLLYDKWLKQIREDKVPLVILEFGAGNSVPTVRYNSEFTVSVLRPHAKLVRVNRWESQVPYNSEDYIAVESGALQALLALRSLLQL